MVRRLFVMLTVLCGAGDAWGLTATWTPGSPETDAITVGYRLYRADGACDAPNLQFRFHVNIGKVLTTNLVPTPPAPGKYCYVLTAFDKGSVESPYSNKVELTVAGPPSAPALTEVK